MRSERQLPDPGKSRVKTYTITITQDPRKPMSMEEFVLRYLEQYEHAYVSDMFRALNIHRVDNLHKRPTKNTSFRALIGEMKSDTNHRKPSEGKRHYPYIKSITPDRTGFEPSAYIITPYGNKRLEELNG